MNIFEPIANIGKYCEVLKEIKGPMDISILTIFIAFITSWNFRKGKEAQKLSILQTLVGTYILGFSGSSLINIMLGQPFTWLNGNIIFYYTFFAVTIHYTISDEEYVQFEKILNFLQLPIQIIDSINKANTIINTIEKSKLIIGSTSYIGVIICGTIGGSGSSIISDIMNINNSEIFTLKKPDILKNSSTVFNFSALSSCVIIILDLYCHNVPSYSSIKFAVIFLVITFIKISNNFNKKYINHEKAL